MVFVVYLFKVNVNLQLNITQKLLNNSSTIYLFCQKKKKKHKKHKKLTNFKWKQWQINKMFKYLLNIFRYLYHTYQLFVYLLMLETKSKT